jgi:FkbM family methyltransferase
MAARIVNSTHAGDFANEHCRRNVNRSLFVLVGRGKGYERQMDPQTQILAQILAPARLTAIVDVGANPIDGDPPYKAMLAAGLCEVVGFEPQADALAKLEKMAGPRERYLPYALGDGTPQTLHVCGLGGMTSLLVPDPAHLALFNLFPTWGTVKEQIPVATRKLDDIAEVTQMDFLKMDAQGAEREVLTHGRSKLKDAVAVQTEVSFIPLYQGQPTLGEMDLLMRGMGFLPHCFAAVKTWPLAPTVVSGQPAKGLRQLLEADLVYVRDFTRRENMNAEQWKHLALIAHHCYGSVDLAARAINMLTQLGAVPADANRRYFASLPSGKPA